VRQTLNELANEGIIYKNRGRQLFFRQPEDADSAHLFDRVIVPSFRSTFIHKLFGEFMTSFITAIYIVLGSSGRPADKELACLKQLLEKQH
jgi:hypothetical protein